ncbi:hypothetical protein DFJ77DRAFT_79052 [Powellomyces hirtus]|nr:hypothetical protein DFJ77DRAFT_79052 [Powellomyces hirtus]
MSRASLFILSSRQCLSSSSNRCVRSLAIRNVTGTRRSSSVPSQACTTMIRRPLPEAFSTKGTTIRLVSTNASATSKATVEAPAESASDAAARFAEVVRTLETHPDLLPLDDLLFILSSRTSGNLSVAQVESLYLALLAVPASRFVFSILHYNHLLSHLLRPSDDTISLIPYTTETIDMVDRVLSDLKGLQIAMDSETYALSLLSGKGDPNLLQQNGLWEWLTSIRKSGCQPSIWTYELLLTGFARLRNVDAVNKIVPKLYESGLTWRSETFAAALAANAVVGNEKWYNRLSYQLRKQKIEIDTSILNGILRYWLNVDKPLAVLKSYYKLTSQFSANLLPTVPDTYIILIEACAAIPQAARPDEQEEALAQARESLRDIHHRLQQGQNAIQQPPRAETLWGYIAKCYASLGDDAKAKEVYNTVKSSSPAELPFVPQPLLLGALAHIIGRQGDIEAVKQFVEETVLDEEVLKAYYTREANVAEQEPFEQTVYENLLMGWLENEKDPEELVATISSLRAEEKTKALGVSHTA